MNPTEYSGLTTPPAIRAEYKLKLAVCYIRQSTLDQVKMHTGSTETQRALAARAQWYGWPPEQIQVIDEDLGFSGTSSDQRTGFLKLLALMENGAVGLVLVRDASRISRDRYDSARFWRVAIQSDVLVEVNGRLRHPANDKATDRFGLEIESILAWYENVQRVEMFQAAKAAKIRQRRAITAPPLGYVKAGQGDWDKGPEPAVCSVIRQGIEAFLKFGSLRKARRHLETQGVRWPRRVRGRIDWEPLADGHLYRVLTNPNYTSDYSCRRTRTIQRASGKKHGQRRSPDEWLTIIDHHEGYTSREEWARIQSMLHQRRRTRQPFPGKGDGLLQGLLACGRCGRWMRTVYDGRDLGNSSGRTARYRCAPQDKFGTEKHRLSCPAAGVDYVVVRAVLEALSTPHLTDALQAIREEEQQHKASDLARRRHIHHVEERVQELKDRYLGVDPARSMLKLELERDLEAALHDLQRLNQPLSGDARSRTVTEAQAAELLRLAADLNAVWHAPTTTNEDRKRILSTALAKIVIHDTSTDEFAIELVWAGGLTERRTLLRRTGAAKLVTQMVAEARTRDEILTALTERGWTTHRAGRLPLPKDLSTMLRRLGLGEKTQRLEVLRRIRQMLIERRSRREILQVLQGEQGQWTTKRLGDAIQSLRFGAWGEAVPALPPESLQLRTLELETIRFLADRRKAGMSFSQIAVDLNARGCRTPRGRLFTESSARFIYRGLRQDPALADLFSFDDPPGARGQTRFVCSVCCRLMVESRDDG